MTTAREIDWHTQPLTHPAIANHEVTCPSVPVQVDGELTDGTTFYFRYRFGSAALGFGPDLDTALQDSWSNCLTYGGKYGGSLMADQLNALFVLLYWQHPRHQAGAPMDEETSRA